MTEGRIVRDGVVWVRKAERATSFLERMRGLLGRTGLGFSSALLIERCGVVHTVGMRFALDLVFLDCAWRVVRVVRGVRPGRLMVCGGWRASRVLESGAGKLDMEGLVPGQTLTFEWSNGRDFDRG